MCKITQIEINLGLNNNPFTDKTDIKTVLESQNFSIFRDDDIRFEQGEYNGESEKTAVIGTRLFNSTPEQINDKIIALCVMFEQECIAYKINGNDGKIAYHNRFKERYEFSPNLFQDFYNKTFFAKNFK